MNLGHRLRSKEKEGEEEGGDAWQCTGEEAQDRGGLGACPQAGGGGEGQVHGLGVGRAQKIPVSRTKLTEEGQGKMEDARRSSWGKDLSRTVLSSP